MRIVSNGGHHETWPHQRPHARRRPGSHRRPDPNDGSTVVDLAAAHASTLRSRGANAEGATRLARALFPSSMSAAIPAGDAFLDAAHAGPRPRRGRKHLGRRCVLDRGCRPAGDPRRPDLPHAHAELPREGRRQARPPGVQDAAVLQRVGQPASTGTSEVLPYPHYTEYLDWEFEIGIVVGRYGHNLTAEERERTSSATRSSTTGPRGTSRLTRWRWAWVRRSARTSRSASGPWIVTADELPTSRRAQGRGTPERRGDLVGGVDRSGSSAPAEMVAWVSVADAVLPGDLIGTGTMGFGSGFELDKRLAPGDVLELDLDRVGVLRTPIGEIEKAPVVAGGEALRVGTRHRNRRGGTRLSPRARPPATASSAASSPASTSAVAPTWSATVPRRTHSSSPTVEGFGAAQVWYHRARPGLQRR